MKKIKFKCFVYTGVAVVVLAISFLNLNASGIIAVKSKSGLKLTDLSLHAQSAAACEDEGLFADLMTVSCEVSCVEEHKEIMYYVDGVPVYNYTYTNYTATGKKMECVWALTTHWCTEEEGTACDAYCDQSGN
jgi:hypothetical protein